MKTSAEREGIGIDDTFVSGRHGTDTKVLWTIALQREHPS
jgi:hypothetical protein